LAGCSFRPSSKPGSQAAQSSERTFFRPWAPQDLKAERRSSGGLKASPNIERRENDIASGRFRERPTGLFLGYSVRPSTGGPRDASARRSGSETSPTRSSLDFRCLCSDNAAEIARVEYNSTIGRRTANCHHWRFSISLAPREGNLRGSGGIRIFRAFRSWEQAFRKLAPTLRGAGPHRGHGRLDALYRDTHKIIESSPTTQASIPSKKLNAQIGRYLSVYSATYGQEPIVRFILHRVVP